MLYTTFSLSILETGYQLHTHRVNLEYPFWLTLGPALQDLITYGLEHTHLVEEGQACCMARGQDNCSV